ncbi:hypothetical protein ACEQ8H_005602 [Pleosporales sp. CAS-2024a]
MDSIDATRNDSLHAMEKTYTVQKAPLLRLPIELVQHVTSYLEAESAASFCLSSRYLYYALGSDCLSQYINSSKNRFVKRRTIEAIVERAFPGHWFCAWCDIFHAWDASSSPSNPHERGLSRDCSSFNSYLSAGTAYALRFHHIRLALAHSLLGSTHGIPLSSLSHASTSMSKIYHTPVPTSLSITPALSSNSTLLVHTSFAMILPSWSTSRKHIIAQIWPTLPHIVAGHRDSDNGHSGLMAAIDNVVRRGWKYPFPQSCATCRTDWTVSAHFFHHSTGAQLRLVVQTWRDVGDAKSPFDQSWRSHGVAGPKTATTPTVFIRNTGLRAGDIRRAFDASCNTADHDAQAHSRTSDKRALSPPRREKTHHAFMASDDVEVRRSRVRPSVWRTRSENEEVERREDEDRMEEARRAAEHAIREDVRGRRV